ncbi:response regulator [Nonlabens sp.]|uniref:response regulator n=1 Tax=Nonlabens sp. TaxID=1888209 RepID=UPI001BCD22AE|nr:response regulator [Nonlabens sp.]
MKKILLIEDNPVVRENTAEILELENYNVTTAENGKKGIEEALKHLPDIIICDIMMPVLDGYAVFESLSQHVKTAHIPFIFLTAKSEKAEIRKGMNLGADDYLTKPFQENELLEAVVSRLKKYSFLEQEFSKDIKGINQFFDGVASQKGMEGLSMDRSIKIFKRKDFVFMEGDTAHKLYLVQSGSIKTYKTTDTGKSFVTGIFGPGQFIGQLSLLANKTTYSDTACVLEKSEIIEIPKNDFTTLIYGDQLISSKFITMISNDLIELQEQLVSMAFESVRQRLAKVLLQLDGKHTTKSDAPKEIHISREDLAGLLGTATETAIRMLTNFKDEGLVTINGRRNIVIQKKEDLEEIIHFG